MGIAEGGGMDSDEADASDEPGLAAEVRRVDEEIADLRRSAVELRRQVAGRGDGTVEPEEISAILGQADELDAIVDTLRTRRDTLTRRLSA
jgi:hypothetical protein